MRQFVLYAFISSPCVDIITVLCCKSDILIGLLYFRVRLDSNTIDMILPNLHLYMHWTQEQILLFFPTYLLESSCGICTLRSLNTNNLYEKL